PGFVVPGGPLDAETRRRGTTVYCPDHRIPLHPMTLSEDAASLLPGQDRPAIVWELDLDADGEVERHDVRRAVVRSRERFDYETVQRRFDAGDPPDPIAPLERFGEARIARGVERGAITIRLPEQEVEKDGGKWGIVTRAEQRSSRWNAEASILTGMVAAEMMIGAGTGILRTLPTPTPEMLGELRGVARSLGIAWSSDRRPGDVLATLDPARPRPLALFEHASRLLRGAGYLALVDGVPDGDLNHGGLAAAYAHVTAPIRRLVDRFGLEICVSVAADRSPPEWTTADLADVPQIMDATGQRAGTVESQCVNVAEAWVMAKRIGESFEAVVLAHSRGGAQVWIDEPPIQIWVPDVQLKPGKILELAVTEVDVEQGRILLQRVSDDSPAR
ncbi:MAG: RNB domain-containing ribonuclease, partial [Acidimicrobiia bacterium]